MIRWTVDALLARVQEYLGEDVGDFYNYQTRLTLLNQAQLDMVRETLGLTKVVSLDYDPAVGVDFPDDFLTFSKITPQFVATDGTVTDLEVVSGYRLQELHPTWRTDSTGTPESILDDTLDLYPTPPLAGTLRLPYVYAPAQLVDDDDEPYDGVARLAVFGEALAMFVANRVLLPSNPQLATVYNNMYNEEQKKMREAVRDNPRKDRFVRRASLEDWT